MVAVLNRSGRAVEMIARDGGPIASLAPHKREILFMGFALQVSMSGDCDDEFGKAATIIMRREKISILLFQVPDHVLVVMTGPLLEPASVQKKIMGLIRDRDGTSIMPDLKSD